MAQRIAFFDFDDTLCKGDSIFPYLLYAIGQGYALWWQVWAALGGYLRWRVNPASASNAKAWTLSFIKGRSREEMDALGRSFFQHKQSGRFFSAGRDELERLRAEGYRVVVVTASAEVYMRLLPEFLPVDDVIATRCPLDGSGCYTGEIGPNCKGDEKPRRIQAWLEEQGLDVDWHACRAYGDSASDAPMLRLVGRPVLVNPKKSLRNILPAAIAVRWQ